MLERSMPPPRSHGSAGFRILRKFMYCVQYALESRIELQMTTRSDGEGGRKTFQLIRKILSYASWHPSLLDELRLILASFDVS